MPAEVQGRMPITWEAGWMQAGLHRRPSYRPEIDGLRAVAVVAVITNHIQRYALPSGFLGVDVFFVISGYVITASLAGRDHTSLAFFLTGFYARRVRRLLPALLVFVLILSVAVSLFDPNPALSLRTGATSLFGLSNLYLAQKATDYFAPAAEMNAFLPTWLLGVEEQFYLIFPLLLWGSGFARRTPFGGVRLGYAVLTLAIASLVSFVIFSSVDPQRVYYLMPPRFWELGAGCLLFLALQRWGGHVQALGSWLRPEVVLVALVAVFFVPQSFSVASTLAVVFLTALLLAVLRPQTWAYQWLTLRPVQYVGLISYSLYLWHWGVLFLSRATIGVTPSTLPWQIGLMLGLAAISTAFIENPLRRARWSRSQGTTVVIGLMAAGVAALGVAALSTPWGGRFYIGSRHLGEERVRDLVAEEHPDVRDQAIVETCSTTGKEPIPVALHRILSSCLWPSQRRGLIAFSGDSHAGRMVPLVRMFSAQGLPIFLHTRRGCVYPTPEGAEPACHAFNVQLDAALMGLFRERGGGVVVAESYFQGHFHPEGHLRWTYTQAPDGSPDSVRRYFQAYQRAVGVLADRLATVGARLVIIAPKPDHEYYARHWDESYRYCSRQWFQAAASRPCWGSPEGTSRRHIEEEIAPIRSALAVVARAHPNVRIYDPFDRLCQGKDRCHLRHNGVSLYNDDNHLSRAGVLFLAQDFKTFLEREAPLPP